MCIAVNEGGTSGTEYGVVSRSEETAGGYSGSRVGPPSWSSGGSGRPLAQHEQGRETRILRAWLPIQPLHIQPSEYTTPDLYESGSGEVLESGEPESWESNPVLPIQTGDVNGQAENTVQYPTQQAQVWTGARRLSFEEVAAIACTEGRLWDCGEVLRVVFGPTPPNPKAPNGCPTGESGGDPNAGTDSLGIFQVHYESHKGKIGVGASLYDPVENARVAYIIWLDGGWGPWSCRP